MQLNMLEAMNIYVNVVEQGSFIRAAEVLELHRPAVTRAVQNLEHDLGVKLLHRTTRQVSMTDEGEEFYQRCLSLLSELDDVRRLFSSTQPPKAACALTSLLRSPGQSSFRLLEIFRTDTRILRLYLARPIARLI